MRQTAFAALLFLMTVALFVAGLKYTPGFHPGR
jgi:hypothetical protein